MLKDPSQSNKRIVSEGQGSLHQTQSTCEREEQRGGRAAVRGRAPQRGSLAGTGCACLRLDHIFLHHLFSSSAIFVLNWSKSRLQCAIWRQRFGMPREEATTLNTWAGSSWSPSSLPSFRLRTRCSKKPMNVSLSSELKKDSKASQRLKTFQRAKAKLLGRCPWSSTTVQRSKWSWESRSPFLKNESRIPSKGDIGLSNGSGARSGNWREFLWLLRSCRRRRTSRFCVVEARAGSKSQEEKSVKGCYFFSNSGTFFQFWT